MNYNAGVYEILNTATNKRYIGSTINLPRRFSNHKKDLVRGNHYNSYLQRAWNKYDETAFTFNVISIVPIEELLIQEEQFWIDAYDSANRTYGYNISPTAGNTLGTRYSEEIKQKISLAKKGKTMPPRSEEHKLKLSLAYKGKTHSPEVRLKLSLAQKGKSLSEEAKHKLSLAFKGKTRPPFSEEHKQKISLAKKGKLLSDETKRKMSSAQQKRRLAERLITE